MYLMQREKEDIYVCTCTCTYVVVVDEECNRSCQAFFGSFRGEAWTISTPNDFFGFAHLWNPDTDPSPPLLSASPLRLSCPADAMDSPVIAHIFRQLFRHRGCQVSHSHPCVLSHNPIAPRSRSHRQCRTYASKPTLRRRTLEDPTFWKHRTDDFPRDMSKELREYPMVTSTELRSRPHRPRRVKMLARDFIEGI